MISTVQLDIDEFTKKANEAQKMLCFKHNYKSVCAEGSRCFIYAHPVVVVFHPPCWTELLPVMLLSACVFWMSLLIWDVVLLESCCGPKQIHAELAATNWQLKIWRDEVWPEARKKVSRTTRSHALLIKHSLWGVSGLDRSLLSILRNSLWNIVKGTSYTKITGLF